MENNCLEISSFVSVVRCALVRDRLLSKVQTPSCSHVPFPLHHVLPLQSTPCHPPLHPCPLLWLHLSYLLLLLFLLSPGRRSHSFGGPQQNWRSLSGCRQLDLQAFKQPHQTAKPRDWSRHGQPSVLPPTWCAVLPPRAGANFKCQ